jgi:solute carrier family 25 2-oxodicarboxylate transporter 21
MLLLVPLLLLLLCRFQSQLPGQKQYTRVFPTLATIWREEGARALYKGFVPKALRLGIGQSVGLVTFQQLLRACGVDAHSLAPKDEPDYIPVPWE